MTCRTGGAPEPERSHIEWTDDNSSIYAHAVRNDLADLSLYDWWLSASGPSCPTGDATATKKDPPASLGPQTPRRVLLISLTEREVKGYDFTGLFECSERGDGGGPSQRWRLRARRQRTRHRERASAAEEAERGRLRPRTCPLLANRSSPVTYEWTAVVDTVTWEKTEGNTCAGPQPLTGIPWTRAPEGLIAFETGGDIGLMDAGGFVVKKLTTETTTRPEHLTGLVAGRLEDRVRRRERGGLRSLRDERRRDRHHQADRPPRRRDPAGVVSGRGPDRLRVGRPREPAVPNGDLGRECRRYGVDGAREPGERGAVWPGVVSGREPPRVRERHPEPAVRDGPGRCRRHGGASGRRDRVRHRGVDTGWTDRCSGESSTGRSGSSR